MTPWEKLEWLQKWAHEVHVTVNGHRGYYETVADYLTGHGDDDLFDAEDADVRAKCIEINSLVEVQVYPNTPISFYRVGHHDLGEAIALAHECASKDITLTPAVEVDRYELLAKYPRNAS